MIFGRKKKKAATEQAEAGIEEAGDDVEVDDPTALAEAEVAAASEDDDDRPADDELDDDDKDEVVDDEVVAEVEEDESAGHEDAGDEDADESGDEDLEDDADLEDEDDADDEEDVDEWAALDRAADRDEGPFDITEVDLTDDEVARLDLGVLIITPFEGAELRLNVVEGTRQVVSAMLIHENSALDVTAFAAPRSGGLWAEVREQVIAETDEAGGTTELVEGPFGTELRRMVPAKGPEGQDGFQPTRTWMAQGPRWALRGVLYGEAAMSTELDSDEVAPLFDAFRDIVVRRGEQPQRSGEVLFMTVPENITPEEPTD